METERHRNAKAAMRGEAAGLRSPLDPCVPLALFTVVAYFLLKALI